jgi:tripartite-type tricarboxylate transporter receptor subunit TctC
MKEALVFPRSIAAAICAAALLAAGMPAPAHAQAYPTRPITLVVSVGPGSQSDVFARMLAEQLQKRLGQSVVVENRPGGGQVTGVAAVAKAAPDGYTLIHGNLSGLVISPQLRNPPPYDVTKDFTPVAVTFSGHNFLLVNPDLPAKTVPEFIAYAKANPGKLNYGSHGVGSFTHVTLEMFKGITGTDMVHIPYNGGGPLTVGFITGQVQVMLLDLVTAKPHIESGKARIIGQVGDQRSLNFPDVPLLSETVDPSLTADFWLGVAAPAGTPPAAVERLNKEINAIVNTPAFKERGAAASMIAQNQSPQQFGAKLAREWESWGKVIRDRKLAIQ